MISQLKDALSKSWRCPRYFLYFLRNIHYLREHFPSLRQLQLKRKALDIGEAQCLRKLHIIMRTTDAVMNMNASRGLEDAGIRTKNDVIRVGGCSLFKAVVRFFEKYGRANVRVTLVVDRLSNAGMVQYSEAANAAGVDFDVIEAKGHGNGPTFQTQIDIALRDSDDTLAFILEDDYLLHGESLTIPFEVMRSHAKIIGFNPHFHPDRVRLQDIGKLVAIDKRMYCRVSSTCCTFFMPVREMRKFEKQLRLYDGWEAGSVNCAWRKGICLVPIGWTLAEHLHRSDLSPVQTLVATP